MTNSLVTRLHRTIVQAQPPAHPPVESATPVDIERLQRRVEELEQQLYYWENAASARA